MPCNLFKFRASDEEEAYEICKSLDVDYVMVVFGGLVGYSGDDINKFYWILKIVGNVYAHIKVEDYLTNGRVIFLSKMSIDQKNPTKLSNSLMYKLSFYNYDKGRGNGYCKNRK